ncbi:MAG: sulfur carrier protein ThiS [Stackebrandtia sp.]
MKSKPRDRLPSTAGNEACGQTPSCGKPSEGSTERPTTAAEETTLNIHVNGEPTETRARTVTDVVAGLTAAHRGVAVAVNGEVVSRAEWPRALREGDRVEVLTANPGG